MSIYTNTTLASYLFNNNNSSSSDTYSQIVQNNLSFLTKKSNGKYALPTQADFANAKTGASQLSVANKLAQSAQVQTNALMQTGITTRAAAMATQSQQAMNALQTATNTINSESGTKGLKTAQTTISSTLTTLKASMTSLAAATKRMSATDAQTVAAKLKSMDQTAQSIAKTANLKWTSPLANTSNNTVTASVTVPTSTPRLIDYLA